MSLGFDFCYFVCFMVCMVKKCMGTAQVTKWGGGVVDVDDKPDLMDGSFMHEYHSPQNSHLQR